MAGGLLNLVSHGQESILIFGNPTKTFFRSVYKKISNFGIQKFRVDYEGSRNLRVNDETKMVFKIPRYAELLRSTFVVVNIPDIWSPLYYNQNGNGGQGEWVETGFKWIEELGSTLIKDVEISSGGQVIARYNGEYFSCIHQRDTSSEKKELWDRMTGNIKELNDPANAYNRINVYPSVYNHDSTQGTIRPSVYGKKLYIPLDTFYSTSPGLAFPLVSLQYAELHITVTLRSIKELYTIREVTNHGDNYPYIAPNQNEITQQFHKFLNPPIDTSWNVASTNETWNADIHLLCEYIFLDNVEREMFAKNEQKYLIKDVYTWDFPNTSNNYITDIDSRGLVSNYTFRFRRSDAHLRNEWNNYTNWAYNTLPYNISNQQSPNSSLYITDYTNPVLENANTKNILLSMGLLLDGKYRENTLDGGAFNYVEKYSNTKGGGKDGLYIYSFSLNTDNKTYQPSGAMNMDKFDKVQLEFITVSPPFDPDVPFSQVCDPVTGAIVGTRKNIWNINEYNFDLRVFEERYNILYFSSGLCGLKYAR
tara:strand:- start:17974 stop:19578 length:1605 start_codon:yes stop_codon:yes gene_type:complete